MEPTIDMLMRKLRMYDFTAYKKGSHLAVEVDGEETVFPTKYHAIRFLTDWFIKQYEWVNCAGSRRFIGQWLWINGIMTSELRVIAEDSWGDFTAEQQYNLQKTCYRILDELDEERTGGSISKAGVVCNEEDKYSCAMCKKRCWEVDKAGEIRIREVVE